MRKIIGLDPGISGTGFAYVEEPTERGEVARIVDCGVSVNTLSKDERTSFERGDVFTTNADRRTARSFRRNIQRFKLRRENLIKIFFREGWIADRHDLVSSGRRDAHELYGLRAKAATEEISLKDLARVFLMINAKRGYKSSRRLAKSDDGTVIDAIDVALQLMRTHQTPGQYAYGLVSAGKKVLTGFYPSDLKTEVRRIIDFQKQFDKRVEGLSAALDCGNRREALKCTGSVLGVEPLTVKGRGAERRNELYRLRDAALSEQLSPDALALVIAEICGEAASSSGLLAQISDRSKQLHRSDAKKGERDTMTIGEYLWGLIREDKMRSLKNITFFRRDYMDEFEQIWSTQCKFHPELIDPLKKEIGARTIFYQRCLRSQKNLIAFCEFETRNRVAPKSSPLFQEFRMWEQLINIRIKEKFNREEEYPLTVEMMEGLARELRFRKEMSGQEIMKFFFGCNAKKYCINLRRINGNGTYASIITAMLAVVDRIEGTEYALDGTLESDAKEDIILNVFEREGFSTAFLADEEEMERLWHLLYSYDDSVSGDEGLYDLLAKSLGIHQALLSPLVNCPFEEEYGSLSAKAMKRILPFFKEGKQYDEACECAGYRHSHWFTAEENAQRELLDRLPLLRMGSLRNPLVEQMVNAALQVVNELMAKYGRPDEIRLELPRQLCLSREGRQRMYKDILRNEKRNVAIARFLKDEGLCANPSMSDIEKYRLWCELGPEHKALYSGREIPLVLLFSHGEEINIEHIIPKALQYDDSLSNKTLEYRDVNLDKGNRTGFDYMTSLGDAALEEYKARVKWLYDNQSLAAAGTVCGISKKKYENLLNSRKDIKERVTGRDIAEVSYISRKLKSILECAVRNVVVTNGSITKALRNEWGLEGVLKELNFERYEKCGLVETVMNSKGQPIRKIKDWTKRMDQRHHAMDALTVAFTSRKLVNWYSRPKAVQETVEIGTPMPKQIFRSEVKAALERIIVWYKIDGRAVTRATNRIKAGNERVIVQETLTPRGQLHKETLYGRRVENCVETHRIGKDTTFEVISKVRDAKVREALWMRLKANDGDAVKAFTGKNSLSKNPLKTADGHEVGRKVEVLGRRFVYCVRKPISEVNDEKVLEDVFDAQIRSIIRNYAESHGGLANLPKDILNEPVWFNKEKGIAIKSVHLRVSANLYGIRVKRDVYGEPVLDGTGATMPGAFVNPRSNHHAEIYVNSEGKHEQRIISLIDCVNRHVKGLPLTDEEEMRGKGYRLLLSIRRNELFVFPDEETGFDPTQIDVFSPENRGIVAEHLFKCQKITMGEYVFGHQYSTKSFGNDKADTIIKGHIWKSIGSLKFFDKVVKIRASHTGDVLPASD